MTIKITSSLLVLFVISHQCCAQNNYGVKGFEPKAFDLTDSTPVLYNGLKAGYTIKDESEKSVGKKGDFSRYKIYFYLTNVGSEAKIMYRNLDFSGHSGPINNAMALFKCNNATGARFTNKMATMELQACKIQGMVETKECGSDKTIQSNQLVDIGYWIKPGETVSKTYPMIVPLGEKPNVTVTFYPEVGNQTGTLMNGNSQPVTAQNFVHIKNMLSNNYLHVQNGPLNCSSIDNEWWSAQWELVPVPGSNNFQIRNRWKNNFICSNSNGLITNDGQSPAAIWMIQESSTSNMFYIKNTSDNARLYLDNGILKLSNSFIYNDNASKWIIEK
jgi:hypothetical protein